MSTRVLLNLLYKLGKEVKREACQVLYCSSATSLINSIIEEHKCKILIKKILKSHFVCKNVWIL